MIDDNATGRPRPIATDRNATDRRQPAAAPTAHQEPACWQADELTALYRHAPIGLAVLDRDLRFIRINDTLAEINGYSVEEHVGRVAWDIVPGLREAAEPLLRRVWDSGEAITGIELAGRPRSSRVSAATGSSSSTRSRTRTGRSSASHAR